MSEIRRLKNLLLRLLDLVHFPERKVPHTIDGMIEKAFNEKRLLELVYDGYRRIVEIHVYGMKNKRDGMITYQIRGQSSSGVLGWKRMHLKKMTNMRVLREKFPGQRNVVGRHSKWDKIFRIVSKKD